MLFVSRHLVSTVNLIGLVCWSRAKCRVCQDRESLWLRVCQERCVRTESLCDSGCVKRGVSGQRVSVTQGVSGEVCPDRESLWLRVCQERCVGTESLCPTKVRRFHYDEGLVRFATVLWFLQLHLQICFQSLVYFLHSTMGNQSDKTQTMSWCPEWVNYKQAKN